MNTTEDWQARVISEREQLMERLGKLTAFLDGETLERTSDDHRLLFDQKRHMQAYADILRQRIARF